MSQDQPTNNEDGNKFEESAEEFVKNYIQKPGFKGDDETWCGESHVMSNKNRATTTGAAGAGYTGQHTQ